MVWAEMIAQTVIGSGVGTAAVGWLFKQKLDRALEVQRAYLRRASNVHERQVDALLKVYEPLHAAHELLQHMNRRVYFEGEKREDYPLKFRQTAVRAYDSFVAGRLLLPETLTTQLDEFFNQLGRGEASFHMSRGAGLEWKDRQEEWKKAEEYANKEIPALVKKIERAAREVIHGEATSHQVVRS